MEISTFTGRCREVFDHVINDNYIYNLPDSPDRWPEAGCDNPAGDPADCPPIRNISTKRVFVATQPSVSELTVRQYKNDLLNGAKMPPVAAIKCKDGVIVWNGHHRLSAHRLAGKKTVPVRYWGTIDKTVKELVEVAGE